jgi:hypothetical protein
MKLLYVIILIIILVIISISIVLFQKYKKQQKINEKKFTVSSTEGNVPYNLTITPASYIKNWSIYELIDDNVKLLKKFENNEQYIQTFEKPSTQKFLLMFVGTDNEVEGGQLITMNVK